MITVLLVIQVIIAIAMITIILLQRSQSDGLAGFSGGGSPDSILSSRASANVLTKTTATLAFLFLVNSLAMAAITAREKGFGERIEQRIEQQVEEKMSVPSAEEPSAPVSVPVAQ